ncbi:RbsD/FucU family protein [Pelagibius sp.]|uniref:RbsD/FucU family protein n=1 Tax=Pelagibius sp. TaxID=1931238 RepID=UPI00260E4534|nr:RbsD/FucU family protein [Pelagibius sp.]
MLKNIDPILSPDLLQVLAAMGHGDDIVVVDANFPADSVARQTVTGRLIRLDGVDVVQAVGAILTVFPLDSFVEAPVRRMEVVGDPDEVPEVQQEVQREIDDAEGQALPMDSIERFAFYEEAKKSYAVVATTEGRAYGCFLLKKGVIFF